MVRYPDATNYEGKKIIVYKFPLAVIMEKTRLDPHFCDKERCVSPFARFEPTEDGWRSAKHLVDQLAGAE
jgi:hypothetical protein